jgi:hypothetical protein
MNDDFFRIRLDQMIDLHHPFAVLCNRMVMQEIEAYLAQRWITSSSLSLNACLR